MSGRHRAPKVVHRLHGAGRKQGNLGRYLFFEIGKQRDERHLIKLRCRLECATATFCGCGKCGGGHITVLGLLLLALMILARRIRDLPSKSRTAQSEHSLSLRHNLKHALKTRGATRTVIQPQPHLPRAWVKTETYHTPKDLRQPNKRVKTSHDDIHMVWVGVASADAQSPYITEQ